LHQGETKELEGAMAKERRGARGWGVPKWHKSQVHVVCVPDDFAGRVVCVPDEFAEPAA